ncbi:MAG: beta-ribofuranosylaminobenzene 5'-phosphate synthase [Candidatus Baldrarchaeia archaeon]
MKVYVKTPCRLHFTLIDLNGALGRIDGGIGVALEYPNVILEVSERDEGITVNVKDDRVISIAEKILQRYKIESGVHIEIKSQIPKHVGLGSTTQLLLAVAKGITTLFGIEASVRELARIAGRGGTSGIGVAAFEGGGFILDGGHTFGKGKQKETYLPSSASRAPPAPLLVRYALPADWMFVVAIPNVERGAHGVREIEIFQKYCPISVDEVRILSHIILMKILPAIVEKDIASFGEGLSMIQNVGFKKVEVNLQSPLIRELMDFMRKKGAYGAGMSSFGPAVYGVIEGYDEAIELMRKTKEFLSKIGGQVFVARANNTGAEIRVL